MNRNMGLGQQDDSRNSCFFAKAVKVTAQDACAGIQRRPAEQALERRRISQQCGIDTIEVCQDVIPDSTGIRAHL